MTQSEAPGVDLIASQLILGTSGIIKKYKNPVIHPPEMNKELDEKFYEAVAKINRLIDDTRKTAYRRGYQAGHAAGKNNSVKGVSRKDFPEIQRKRELWLKKQR